MNNPGDRHLAEACDLGYTEDDGARYCFAHGGFVIAQSPRGLICDRKPAPGDAGRQEPS